jgi:chitinase
VGGWTLSGFFSGCSANPQQRSKIATQLTDFIETTGWDGVDIDWEYPEVDALEGNQVDDNDGENYILLLEDVRADLDARFGGKGTPGYKMLSIAAGMGPRVLNSLARPRPGKTESRMSGICNALDLVNVMTYDFAGPWQKSPGHLSPMNPHPDTPEPYKDFNAKNALENLLSNAGCTKDKIVIGAPMYGRAWQNATGLFQESDTKAFQCGSWWVKNHKTGEEYWSEVGYLDFTDIDYNYKGKEGWTYTYDEISEAPYLFNKEDGVFITYEDERSVKVKVDMIKDEGYAGIMFWSLATDRDEKLLDVAVEGLCRAGNPDTPEFLLV